MQWVVLALGDIFVMNEIESYRKKKDDEVEEHLPEWMRILKNLQKIKVS